MPLSDFTDCQKRPRCAAQAVEEATDSLHTMLTVISLLSGSGAVPTDRFYSGLCIQLSDVIDTLEALECWLLDMKKGSKNGTS